MWSSLPARCRSGWARGGWRCAAAGLPLALVALSAALVLAGGDGLPGLPRPAIGRIMRLEGYAFFTGFLYAFCMLVVGPILLAKVRPAWGVFFAVACLLAVLGFIIMILRSTTHDPVVLLQYLGVIALSYAGIFLDPRRAHAVFAWGARTIWMIVCFFVVLLAVRPPVSIDSWNTQQSVMAAALLYFLALAAAEWSGFYFGLGEDPARPR